VLVSQETLPQLERLGGECAARLVGWLTELGVQLVLGTGVQAVHDGRAVELDSGARLAADAVVLGMGVSPDSALARDAGLRVDDGAIVVDQAMRCIDAGGQPVSAGRVLAAGDVALAHNAAAGRALRVEHWGDALGQGAVAGAALAGDEARWSDVPGFWSEVGDHTIKYAAWGDGFDEAHLVDYGEESFTIWYGTDGVTVGVLTHGCDEDYERGREAVAAGSPLP
jgi:NADPH-dependent 2,4-dienoyl-CoA reductase/sulfur reductase-like enzyme